MNHVSATDRRSIYRSLLDLLYSTHCGHIGSCLSCLDILAHVWKFEKRPHDTFILSKGHAAPSLYVVMHHLKKITKKQLMTFHQNGTILPAHTPNYHFPDDIPFPTGSLGHGLSLSCGIAHASKLAGTDTRAFVMMSDGECNEGQVWEAAQYASAKGLDNVIAMIDRNRIQAFGRTAEVLGDAASEAKWNAFGFETFHADGHDPKVIGEVFAKVTNSTSGKPKMIIFDTVKGHGVSFMEDTIDWHYCPMDKDHYGQAIKEVESL
jgi:transketolase